MNRKYTRNIAGNILTIEEFGRGEWTAKVLGICGEGDHPDSARLDLFRGLFFAGLGDSDLSKALWKYVRTQFRGLRGKSFQAAAACLNAEIDGDRYEGLLRREFFPLVA